MSKEEKRKIRGPARTTKEDWLNFDYPESEADVRARLVYFTQIGYEIQATHESTKIRTSRSRDDLLCLAGREPTHEEIQSHG